MIKEIKMPAGGQTTDTSAIGAWLVKKGDTVKRGDALLEIETDKATLAVESVASGTILAILASEGDKVPAGDIIAFIGDESDMPEVEIRLRGGETASAPKEAETAACSAKEHAAPQELEEDEYQPIERSKAKLFSAEKCKRREISEVKAMPNAKKLAKEKDVRLCDVADFTGKSFLKASDVLDYMDNSPKFGNAARSAQSGQAETTIPLTNMRRTIAKRMLESTSSIPSFQAETEIDMSSIINLRKAINDTSPAVKVSYNDIIFKCVSASLNKYPYINSSFTDSEIIIHNKVNIGLAVSVDGGLVVPVVNDVNSKTIAEIAETNRENIAKARSGNLSAAEMKGGTITVSNMGMYPITRFSAIINPPEACILAIGALTQRPVFENGEIKPVNTITVTASFDHRVIDGAYGAQFLTVLKQIMENPALVLYGG